ncbi:cuticle protein AM1199-like [Penaeus japonicus]|uniref:cuticle protein AM1199-like n=1 Tax=Penaeus japonicus TaxID=27405 RepID=UPI001C71294F|nr:cuticle protein AM1199-like [Penaeus japonicus]
MKFTALFALATVAAAAKLPGHNENTSPIPILFDNRQAPTGGFYSTDVETGNGIRTSERGEAGTAGQTNSQGTISYVSPDGQLIEITYTADEFGFRPSGAHIPTPHPLPAHALKQIEDAERLRALEAQNF